MIVEQLDVKWIVDPGSWYDADRINEFLKWIEEWDKPVLASGRYYQLKEHMVFWGAHKFHLGLQSEEDAREFRSVWGGFMAEGAIVDGNFKADNANAYMMPGYWARRPADKQ